MLTGPYDFDERALDCVVGGVSALDIPRLTLSTPEQAREFVLAYGYDVGLEADREQLWATHRRAVALIQDQLLDTGEVIPSQLVDAAELGAIENLLLIASRRESNDREIQRWACAILRVMHVYVHLRNDLFSAFYDEIQNQILKPVQSECTEDTLANTVRLGRAGDPNPIRLHKFEVKPFKTTASSVIKLLARPEKVALTLLDKLGMRFVTRGVYDSFRVIKFLVENHLVSYPHIIPDQSNNTLYPVNIFLETMKDLEQGRLKCGTASEIEAVLLQRLADHQSRAEYLAKTNEFSGPDYRFIKFINRKLITVTLGAGDRVRDFRFFYPYEIQIMDYATYVSNLSGLMAHDEYKKRQRSAARTRVLGSDRLATETAT